MAHAASVNAMLQSEEGISVLTYEDLHIQDIISSVSDDRAGAIASFIGTTRNSFKGKVVTRLEYQAYSKAAIKTMSSIIQEACSLSTRSEHNAEEQQASTISRCAVYHRLGTVPVGQPSIVIAVSSPHRKEAFVACEYILEEVKRKAQIWKREYYEGEPEETAEWKANH
ncbi:molybdenum cofactor synthesis 2 [Schizophyllum amplum]|uniref:Molybdenum cofactor synthesis 2 n=1 Tax=Schizophyllum amplum TaxID=97359 RepID=A0A550C5W6_9AGAR|nr:molybdenum cofactor synthesis 2 [Auriculariopsis ampla]